MKSHDSSAARFYVEAVAVGRVELTGDEAHHAAHVLRLREGAEVQLFDGRGGRAAARLIEVKKGRVTADVLHIEPPARRPRPRVHLGFAVPKGKRLDWLLEKATELGAASLRPVVFERSVAGGDELSEGKLARWSGHCIAAAKQCRLDFLPEILPHQTLAEHLREACDGPRLMGDGGGGVEAIGAALARCTAEELRLLVGPEGDFTDAEKRAAVEAGWQPVRLGVTTLRVETAAVALLAAVVALSERR